MDFRKIIKFGKTSFVITLPKGWITKNNLKKGDLIGTEEKEGNLVVHSKPDKKKKKSEPKRIVINVKEKDGRDIQREIISAYINNYNVMVLSGKGLNDKIKEIRKALTHLIALEVVEQTKTKIIAKDYLNMDKISVIDSIKKADMITRSMLSDLKEIPKKNHYKSIYHRDQDINRLSFLLYRAIKYALDNPDVYKMYGYSIYEMIQFWQLTTSIERIADNAKRIARSMKEIDSKKQIDMIKKLHEIAEKRYLDTMKAFYNNDAEFAHQIARTKTKALNKCEEQIDKTKESEIIQIIDKIKQMISDTHDITREIYLFLLDDS